MKYSFKNIYNFVVGNVLYTLDRCGALPVYIKDQVEDRKTRCVCSNLHEAQCCGCSIPAVFYAPKACSKGNYEKLYFYRGWKRKSKVKLTKVRLTPMLKIVSRWDKLSHDFGNQPANAKLQTEFHYHGDLNIKSIETSCGCVTTSYKDKVLTVNLKIKNTKETYRSYKYIYVFYDNDSMDTIELITMINGKG